MKTYRLEAGEDHVQKIASRELVDFRIWRGSRVVINESC